MRKRFYFSGIIILSGMAIAAAAALAAPAIASGGEQTLRLEAALSMPAYAAAAPAASATNPAASVKSMTMAIDIFRPACRTRGIMVLFSGYQRNSPAYRDWAKPAARHLCLLVYAPHFSKNRFPRADYQYGGQGLAMLPPLLAWARADAAARNKDGRATGAVNLPLILVGHSAGAQYLSRAAAYGRPVNAPIILLSAGTYAEPTQTAAPPYGFRGLGTERLAAYLALPLTIMVGGADTKANAHLPQTPPANAEGANRLSRAQNFWQAGARQAARLRTDFHWQIYLIPAAAHSPKQMLQSPLFIRQLRALLSSPE